MAGQQTYFVPGGYDYTPLSITVTGSAATFTTALDVDSGQRTITIPSPTISASGQPIVITYNNTEATFQSPQIVSFGDNVDFTINSSTLPAAVLYQAPVDNYTTLTVTVPQQQVGLAWSVEVTNDPAASVGWAAIRGISEASGTVTSGQSTNTIVSFPIGGFKHFRVRRTASATSGTTQMHGRLTGETTITDMVVNGSVSLSASSNATTSVHSVATLASAAATTNATLVKGSGGRLYHVEAYNASASVKFLKLFNKASAPVPGTDTPYFTIALPPGQRVSLDFDSIGLALNTGIGYAITGAAAPLDNTAIAAGDVVALFMAYL